MLDIKEIHHQINQAVRDLINQLMMRTAILKRTPGLCNLIAEYCLRDGKRIRSTLFALAYLGKKEAACRNLFTSAASLELLHLFALIQDDVIDNSDTRRGKASLHKIIDLSTENISSKQAQDLSIVFSDILYSVAIEAFLRIEGQSEKKITALKVILDAAVNTGSGQFLELIYSSQNLNDFTLNDIYEIYDLKTARYTFCGPLIAGAQLAGASETEIAALNQIGLYLGRAYQISDDLFECTNENFSSGVPSDIVEQRKTILMWHLYHNGPFEAKRTIEKLQTECTPETAIKLIEMFKKYGSISFATLEMESLYQKAFDMLQINIFKAGTDHIITFVMELFNHYTTEKRPIFYEL